MRHQQGLDGGIRFHIVTLCKNRQGGVGTTGGAAATLPLHRAINSKQLENLNTKWNLLKDNIGAVLRGHDAVDHDTFGHDQFSTNDRGGNGGAADNGVGADDDVVFADQWSQNGATGTDDDASARNHTAGDADALLQAQEIMCFYAARYGASCGDLRRPSDNKIAVTRNVV